MPGLGVRAGLVCVLGPGYISLARTLAEKSPVAALRLLLLLLLL